MEQLEIAESRSDPRRLRAVHGTGLLDTPSTAALDRLTRLAAKLIDAPATFISLVDTDRDFYVSHSGFGEPLASTRELRGTTFCHYAMVNDGPLLIDDTRAHPVYRHVPTVDSLGVAAYLGIPLKAAGGEVIGSLCAVDFKPRAWTQRERTVMEELAESAMREISLLETIGLHVRKADEAEAARLLAEKAIVSRRDIINSVVHDLREPLNAILLALGPIEAAQTDDRSARPLAIARRQVARMSRLLEDLLDVARIDGGSLHIEREPLDVALLLAEVAADFAMQADTAGIAIEVEVAPGTGSFQGDHARMAQALSNLMSNALKFTPRGGRVRLAARLEGEVLRLEVADSGCGIDTPQLEKVFDPFWQADPARRKGAGLGLHIVRGIVERHGGVVRVRSALGAGTTFELDLPRSSPSRLS
jgi:signal transduction histidine kinase